MSVVMLAGDGEATPGEGWELSKVPMLWEKREIDDGKMLRGLQ